MKTLVINCGSSSIKATLFEMKKEPQELAKILIDGIGLKRCKISFKAKDKNIGHHLEVKDYEEAVRTILNMLTKTKTISKLSEIEAVGHRVVHGGEKYTQATVIDAKLTKEIEELIPLAPLHNPANLEGIKACKKLLPKAKQTAIFDTAFHQTMPEKAFLYGLPYELYEKHKIRRYGFHGTSHNYVVQQAIKMLKNKKARIISCHMGNGISVTASIGGKSVDTSMGMTPLEGPIMGTRSGSVDPGIIFHLGDELKMKPKEINDLLNNKSGLKGLSGISSDMREIYQTSLKKDEKALRTMALLSYQLAKYCGAYTAAMNGVDALVFTGGMGEKAFYLREMICEYLEFLGLKLDLKQNRLDSPTEISEKKSKVKVYVIPTNEERQIAMEVGKR